MRLHVVTTGPQPAHAAPGHVERPERVAAAEEALRASGLPLAWRDAEPVDEALLREVHEDAHLRGVRAACARGAMLDPDTYATPASWDAALRACGGAVQAARLALAGEPAFALGRPPGHHATRGRAMGFCLLSNVAVAAHALAREGKRVAVVDVDVHHGNGTQDVLWERDDALFVSLHGWPLYPGTGAVEEHGEGAGRDATLNLPLPAGTGHEGWLEVFEKAAVPAVASFAPDIILVSAGYDAHFRDPLGNLLLAGATFHACVAALRRVQPRMACVLEGGYDLQGVAAGVHATAAALLGEPAPPDEGAPPGRRAWDALAPRVARHPLFA